jgi:hypothetical protein
VTPEILEALGRRVAASQTFVVPSELAEARERPSGEKEIPSIRLA